MAIDPLLDPFKKKNNPHQRSADEIFQKPVKGGGGGGGTHAPKQSSDDNEDDADERARREQANNPPPEKPVDRTVVKITNIKWDREKVKVGGTAFTHMDVEIPPEHAHVTGITCTIDQLMPGGAWKPTSAKLARCDVDKGKANCELLIPEPLKDKDGKVPSKIEYRVTAKHAYSKETSGPGVEVEPGTPDADEECVIFYSPANGKYLTLDSLEDYQSLQAETDALENLKGKTREAWEISDPMERKKKMEEIHEESDKLFEGEAIASTGGTWDGPLQELILIRQNPRWGKKPKGWVYIRPNVRKNGTPVTGHWRSEKDATLKNRMDKLLNTAPSSKERGPLLDGEFKFKLIEGNPLVDKQFPFKWHHPKEEKEGKIGDQAFTFSKEAAVARFSLGWDGAEATASLKEKKFRVGTTGHVSYGLFEGKMEGKFPYPEKGINLLEFMGKNIKYLDGFIKQGRVCLMRVMFKLSAKAFAGLTVSGALALLDVDLTQEEGTKKKTGESNQEQGKEISPSKAKISSGVDVNGFAGGQVSAGFEISPEWSPTNEKNFKALGQAGLEAGGMAGGGGEYKWMIEYEHGNFYFRSAAGFAWGLGLRGAFDFEVSLEQGWEFIGNLLHSVDYHHVGEIEAAAFQAYKNYVFTLMTEGEAVLLKGAALTREIIGDFGKWLVDIGDNPDDVNASIRESASHFGSLTKIPPEALGQAIITQMKQRNPENFDTVLKLLNSTVRANANINVDPSANHKLKWTLRCVSGMVGSDQSKVEKGLVKDDAMKKGIDQINNFGLGVGYPASQDGRPIRNMDFLKKIQALLKTNGVNVT